MESPVTSVMTVTGRSPLVNCHDFASWQKPPSPRLFYVPLSYVNFYTDGGTPEFHARFHDGPSFNPELTWHQSCRRLRRFLKPLPSAPTRDFAIHTHSPGHTHNSSENVLPLLVNRSPEPSTSSKSYRNGTLIERSSKPSPHHVPINHPPLLSNITDLAAHHGIPRRLPPAPSTTSNKPAIQKTTNPTFPDYNTLIQDYLRMLGQNSMSTTQHDFEDEGGAVERMMGKSPVPSRPQSQPPDNHPFLVDLAEPVIPSDSSPSFMSMEDFLTSPALSTPYEKMSDDFGTPLDDSPFADFLNTPIMESIDGAQVAGNPTESLFPEYPDFWKEIHSHADNQNKTSNQTSVPALLHNLLPITPDTPALDSVPASANTSPNFLPEHSFPPSASGASSSRPRRGLAGATGTRKNISPESLVPLDAPIQSRKYLTPSATSRKEVPARFAKKRSRSAAFGDGDGDEELDDLPPNATEKEQIEWKRKQNTIAARKSRKRKLEYTQNLETENEDLRMENERLRSRVETLEGLIQKGAGGVFNLS